MAFQHNAIQVNTVNANPSGYYEYLPDGYNASNTHKCIIACNGDESIGNGTTEIDRLLRASVAQRIDTDTSFAYDAIILTPQRTQGGAGGRDEIIAFVTWALTEYNISELIFWGYSSGTGTVNDIVEAETFTETSHAITIANLSAPNFSGNTIPYWAIHSFSDPITAILNSNRCVGWHKSLSDANSPMNLAYPYGAGDTVADDTYTMSLTSDTPTYNAVAGYDEVDPVTQKLKLTVIDAVTDVTPWNASQGAGQREHGSDFDVARATEVWEWAGIQEVATPVPENVNATIEQTQVLIQWDSVAVATSYDVEWEGVIENTTDTFLNKTGLTPATEYEYRVRAKGESGDSDWTTLTAVTTRSSSSSEVTGPFNTGNKPGNLPDQAVINIGPVCGGIRAWTTSNRPTATPLQVWWGVNLSNNKMEHTTDGGATWYNADGTTV